MTRITERQLRVLGGVSAVARPSTYIADDLHEETHWIASTLLALEQKSLIECTKRGGRGVPSEWKRTTAGSTALVAIQP